jgi:signal transduction histidine kinase
VRRSGVPDGIEDCWVRVREAETALEEERHLAAARNRLLESNIRELNEIYLVLKEKLRDLRKRDERIRAFEERLSESSKLASLGELAGSIAHEIKNPLISIQGFAERIEKTGDREKVTRYARLIGKEAGRLSRVLINLLDYSRMSEPTRELADLNEVIEDTLLFMEHHLTRFRNVSLRFTPGQALPRVRVDRVQVQQIIVNIIMNAAQAMPQGGAIGVTTEMKEGVVLLAVSDEGTGIAEENLRKIFDPYFTTKRKGEGTGLGLSLCKKLAEANGGTIEVESRVGRGTTMRVLIPAAEETD